MSTLISVIQADFSRNDIRYSSNEIAKNRCTKYFTRCKVSLSRRFLEKFMPRVPGKKNSIVLVALVAAGCSHAPMHNSPPAQTAEHTATPAHAAPSQPATVSIQDDRSAWKRSPHMHAFYD